VKLEEVPLTLTPAEEEEYKKNKRLEEKKKELRNGI
jgi:hypothetical protein